MIVSLQHVAISEDPIPVLKHMASAGGFTNDYVGYANKTAKFSDPTGVPTDYDPTGRPWYQQAAVHRRRVCIAGTGNGSGSRGGTFSGVITPPD